MRAAAVLILPVSLTLMLSACQREPAKEEAADEPGAVASADPSPTPAAPARLGPRLKAGVWRVTMTGDSGAMTSRMCVDAAMQERMNVIGAEQQAGACQQNTVSPLPGGGWAVYAVCDSSATGGGKSTTTGRITGDMTTRYENRMTTVTTGYPVAHMNGTTELVAEGVYEGPCGDGMKAGDIEMPGGIRFNMVDMAAGAARAGKPAG